MVMRGSCAHMNMFIQPYQSIAIVYQEHMYNDRQLGRRGYVILSYIYSHPKGWQLSDKKYDTHINTIA